MTNRRFLIFAVTASLALIASTSSSASEPQVPRSVVIFGDSLTAGLGVEPEDAYPALLQKRIEAAGLPFEIVNAGLSGETTAAGARRVSWILRRPVAVFVLALGGNDGLRGIPTAETEKNLQATIDAVLNRYPDARIILAGMEAPPNMGEDFTAQFRAIFPRLAKKNKIPFVPFLLEGVGGVAELNQGDGIHPNPAGHRILADNIWQVLEPVLREVTAAS